MRLRLGIVGLGTCNEHQCRAECKQMPHCLLVEVPNEDTELWAR